MDPPQSSSPNPNSLKRRFAKGFLRALMRIQKQGQPKSPSSNSPREIAKRRRQIKIAADAAMASAVGPSRVWSQAVLWRIRNNNKNHNNRNRRCGRRSSGSVFRRIGACNSIPKAKRDGKAIGKEKRLRKVVPGGESMDICSLLDETAHYIRCLTTQVKVMKRIDEISSTT